MVFLDQAVQKKSTSLSTVINPVFTELKLQHRDGDVRRNVIEDLEKSLHAAEDLCHGITDKMISHILERVKSS
ncbi:hypothetical protein HF521_005846 [Silurus meridionalis]|uniref:Uncharacterized protein n=1 Tax=Silurus meridionalis TaxID=175797 RepID=A0A8T0AXK6_SILME|nr:hypothetical protein HF521_005846 [Silurus meridionalis]